MKKNVFRSCLTRNFHITGGEFIKISIIDEVGLITLSDPGRLNALTVNMGESFTSAVAALTVAAKDQLIRAVVITGDGEAFSAGGDLNWLADRNKTSPFKNSSVMVDFYNRFLCIRNIGVPTIAAINGAAIGAGMCMTLACDIRIASSTAKLGFTFTKLGIHPGMGSSTLLPRLVGQEMASYLLLSGAVISGEEARQKGLVLEAVDKVSVSCGDDNALLVLCVQLQVLPRALEIARQMGANSPIAVQSCVLTLRSQKVHCHTHLYTRIVFLDSVAQFAGLEAGLLREADAQAVAYSSQDFLRGIAAVKTKSAPHFLGWEEDEEKEQSK